MRKFFAIPVLLGLAVLGAMTLGSLTRPAQASFDSWSGKREIGVPFTASITAGTSQVLQAAATTSTEQDGIAKALVVKSIVIGNSATGFVSLYSHGATSSLSAGDLIGMFPVTAGVPLTLTEDHLGNTVMSRVGDPISVNATTGTVYIQARIGIVPTSTKH